MKYSYWLANVPELSVQKMKYLCESSVLSEEIYHTPLHQLYKVDGITENDAKCIYQSKKVWDIDKEWFALIERGIGFVSMEQSEFPERVRHISNNPYALYYVGKLPDRKSVV